MAFTISTGSLRTYEEGGFVTFSWRMERSDGQFIRNTIVPFTINGLSASDVVGGQLQGTVRIDQFGSGTLRIQLAADQLSEGNETFFVSSSANGVSFRSTNITAIDTSTTPRPSPPPAPPPSPAPAPVPQPAPVPPPAGDTRLHSGSRNSDNITGSSLKDTLFVSDGADRFDGGANTDTFDLSGLASVLRDGELRYIGRATGATYQDIQVRGDLTRASRNVELATTFTRYDLFERTRFDINTTLLNVENLLGTEFSDLFKGTSQANLFRTYGGRDTLQGMDGDDTLDGGDGADLIDGGNGTDVAVLKGLASNYRFSRSGSDILAARTVNGRDEVDTLRSIEKIQFDSGIVDVSALFAPPKSHTLRALDSSVNEGARARFEVSTTGYAAGETLSYTLSGISAADVAGGQLSGNVSVGTDGKGIIEVLVLNDNTTEGPETLRATVGTQTSSMTVNDTSTRPSEPNGRTGTNFPDRLTGTGGNDVIDGGAGNDTIIGLAGNDYLIGGLGDDSLDGGAGIDRLAGGAGNDRYVVDHANDIIEERAFEGTDYVSSSVSWTLATEVEYLVLTGLRAFSGTGNGSNNGITGNAVNNTLDGGAGNDTLMGLDGDDRLIGGLGKDSLVGGAGADTFVYSQVNHSPNSTAGRDVISDFRSFQDKIDLSGIDANPGVSGNQAFTFSSTVPGGTRNATGLVWFDRGFLYASIDSSPGAELAIELVGVRSLASVDIIL